MALAGMGRPMNEVVWRVSMLNRARRSAPQTGMSSTSHFTHSAVDMASRQLYMIMAGATPKLTRSQSESSSLPRSE